MDIIMFKDSCYLSEYEGLIKLFQLESI